MVLFFLCFFLVCVLGGIEVIGFGFLHMYEITQSTRLNLYGSGLLWTVLMPIIRYLRAWRPILRLMEILELVNNLVVWCIFIFMVHETGNFYVNQTVKLVVLHIQMMASKHSHYLFASLFSCYDPLPMYFSTHYSMYFLAIYLLYYLFYLKNVCVCVCFEGEWGFYA